jgi:hypothetical protein
MKTLFLIFGGIGMIYISLRCGVMETNHLIGLCTATLLCYMIYVHDSLEEKLNNKNKKSDETKSKENPN